MLRPSPRPRRAGPIRAYSTSPSQPTRSAPLAQASKPNSQTKPCELPFPTQSVHLQRKPKPCCYRTLHAREPLVVPHLLARRTISWFTSPQLTSLLHARYAHQLLHPSPTAHHITLAASYSPSSLIVAPLRLANKRLDDVPSQLLHLAVFLFLLACTFPMRPRHVDNNWRFSRDRKSVV